MKAKELNIGDWVINPVHKDTVKIDGIYFDKELFCLVATDGRFPQAYFEPIPITEEILKANGFKKLDLTIGNYALKLEEKEKYDIHTILWGGVFNGRMEFKVIGEYIHIDKKIRYVHELQHALRLCGLNDLADCFKVE